MKIIIFSHAMEAGLSITREQVGILESSGLIDAGYSGEIGHVFQMKSAIDSGGNKASWSERSDAGFCSYFLISSLSLMSSCE